MFTGYQLIDLSVTLDEQLPCSWPTHLQFQRKNYNWYAKVAANGVELADQLGPYYTEWLLIDEHTGTHFDAPSHFIPPEGSGMKNAGPAGAFTGEKVDVADLIGPAVVIDLTRLTGKGFKGESPFIVPDDIKAWEKSNGAIGKGDIVLFYTGWDKYYLAGEAGKAYAYNPLVAKEGAGWPAPNADTALYLAERGVRCVGTDGTSMGSSHDGGPVHIVGLGKNLRYVEGLTNLGKLPARGAYFLFLPLKIAGSSGAPGRAVAFAPQK